MSFFDSLFTLIVSLFCCYYLLKINKDIINTHETNLLAAILLTISLMFYITFFIFGIYNAFNTIARTVFFFDEYGLFVWYFFVPVGLFILFIYPLVAFFILLIFHNQFTLRKFDLYKLEHTNIGYNALIELVSKCAYSMGFVREPQIYFSKIKNLSPFIYKTSKASFVIVFPDNIMSLLSRTIQSLNLNKSKSKDQLLELIIKHELGHILNRDNRIIYVLNLINNNRYIFPLLLLSTLTLPYFETLSGLSHRKLYVSLGILVFFGYLIISITQSFIFKYHQALANMRAEMFISYRSMDLNEKREADEEGLYDGLLIKRFKALCISDRDIGSQSIIRLLIDKTIGMLNPKHIVNYISLHKNSINLPIFMGTLLSSYWIVSYNTFTLFNLSFGNRSFSIFYANNIYENSSLFIVSLIAIFFSNVIKSNSMLDFSIKSIFRPAIIFVLSHTLSFAGIYFILKGFGYIINEEVTFGNKLFAHFLFYSFEIFGYLLFIMIAAYYIENIALDHYVNYYHIIMLLLSIIILFEIHLIIFYLLDYKWVQASGIISILLGLPILMYVTKNYFPTFISESYLIFSVKRRQFKFDLLKSRFAILKFSAAHGLIVYILTIAIPVTLLFPLVNYGLDYIKENQSPAVNLFAGFLLFAFTISIYFIANTNKKLIQSNWSLKNLMTMAINNKLKNPLGQFNKNQIHERLTNDLMKNQINLKGKSYVDLKIIYHVKKARNTYLSRHDLELPKLINYQNADGGFGELPGLTSNLESSHFGTLCQKTGKAEEINKNQLLIYVTRSLRNGRYFIDIYHQKESIKKNYWALSILYNLKEIGKISDRELLRSGCEELYFRSKRRIENTFHYVMSLYYLYNEEIPASAVNDYILKTWIPMHINYFITKRLDKNLREFYYMVKILDNLKIESNKFNDHLSNQAGNMKLI